MIATSRSATTPKGMGIEKMQTADGGTITIPTGGKKGAKSNKSHRQQLTCAVVIGSNVSIIAK